MSDARQWLPQLLRDLGVDVPAPAMRMINKMIKNNMEKYGVIGDSRPTLTVLEGGLSTMEKHGVVKDEEKTKTASTAKGKCPSCGSELTKEGDDHIDHCPQCGTKPFEKKPEQV